MDLLFNDGCCGGDIELEQFAGGEVADESAVGGEKFVLGKIFETDPLELVEDFVLQLSIERGHGEELQVDGAAVAIVVADVGNTGSDFCEDAQFFLEFAGESLFRTFALFYFPAGKLPLQRHWLVGATLADQDHSIANQQTCYNEAESGTRWARVGNGLRFFHAFSVNAGDKNRV